MMTRSKSTESLISAAAILLIALLVILARDNRDGTPATAAPERAAATVASPAR